MIERDYIWIDRKMKGREIVAQVAKEHGLKFDDLAGPSRLKPIVKASPRGHVEVSADD